MIEWYGTPPYCAILRIKISNKISHKLIKFFFPKELKRIHYESQSNEFKSQRLQFLLFQKLLNIVKLKLWKCFDNIVLLSTLMLRCPLLAALSLLYTVTWFQTVRLSIITKIILSKLLIFFWFDDWYWIFKFFTMKYSILQIHCVLSNCKDIKSKTQDFYHSLIFIVLQVCQQNKNEIFTIKIC